MHHQLPQLVALPHWSQRSATTLQEMAIAECPNLTALPDWLPNFVSLGKLGIVSCHKLLSLPMGSLTALRSFGVVREDWLNIAHASIFVLMAKD